MAISICPRCTRAIDLCDCSERDNIYLAALSKQLAPTSIPAPSKDPLTSQVGGDHYKQFTIQPLEFTIKNNLDFIQGNIVKYACRHKTKNGVEDLKKVIHYAQLAAKLQYGEEI